MSNYKRRPQVPQREEVIKIDDEVYSIPGRFKDSEEVQLTPTGTETIIGDKTFQDDVTVEGDLTVNGDTTFLDTEQLYVEDNLVTLNSNASGVAPTLDAGIEVERGTELNAQVLWDESEDEWAAGVSGSLQPIVLQNDLLATSGALSAEIDSDVAAEAAARSAEIAAVSGVLSAEIDTDVAAEAAARDAAIASTSGALSAEIDSDVAAEAAARSAEIASTSGNLQSQLDLTVKTYGDQSIAGDKTFTDDVIIEGNLSVTGSQIILNTEELLIEDNIITLNSSASGTPVLDAGIEINRGSETYSQFLWDESEDHWVVGLSGNLEKVLASDDWDISLGVLAGKASSNEVVTDTSDGSDTALMKIGGGGVATETRGGFAAFYGNEHASFPGITWILAGTATNARIRFATGPTGDVHTRWNIEQGGHLMPEQDNSYAIGGSGKRVSILHVLSANINQYVANNGAGTTDQVLTKMASGNTEWQDPTSASLFPPTSDGADNSTISIGGGGAPSTGRGGFTTYYGNEEGSFPGVVWILAGEATNANIRFASGTTGDVHTRWTMEQNGHLLPGANNSYNIGASGRKVAIMWIQSINVNQYVDNVGSAGSSGQVLTSNGTNAVWQNIAVNNSNWSGTDLSVANGGTGSSTQAGARANLAAAKSAANTDITSLSPTGDLTLNPSSQVELGATINMNANQLNMESGDIVNIDDMTFAGTGSAIDLNGGDINDIDDITMRGTGSILNMNGGDITNIDDISGNGVTSITAANIQIISNNGSISSVEMHANGRQGVWRSGGLDPHSNNTKTLGQSTIAWARVHTYKVRSPSVQEIHMEPNNGNSSHRWIFGNSGIFTPQNNNTQDLGVGGLWRVRNAYIQGYIGPFTGAHMYKVADGENLNIGDTVSISNKEIVKTTQANDSSCIGIVSSDSITNSGVTFSGADTAEDSFGVVHDLTASGMDVRAVASVGDATTGLLTGFNVCDEGGAVTEGTLLTTASGYPGYVKAQADDIIRAYTVGKALEDVSFSGTSTVSGVYGVIYCG